jgi:hypothetical protein
LGYALDGERLELTTVAYTQRPEQSPLRRELVGKISLAARDRAVMHKWWIPELGQRRLSPITPVDVQHVVDSIPM